MTRSGLGRRFWALGLAALVLGIWSVIDPVLAFASDAGSEASEIHGFKNSLPVAGLFWLFALGSLGGSLMVITRRNMVSAVMWMVATFFAIAGLYLMLYASFMAVMQVLVYAGAIMVLFVFVIMILNREEEEPWAVEGLLGKGLAGLGLLYLFYRIAQVLWSVRDQAVDLSQKATELHKSLCLVQDGSPPIQAAREAAASLGEKTDLQSLCKQLDLWREYDFGSIKGVGYTLFHEYLFPFEAVSLVLLVAVVGAIAIARPRDKDDEGVDNEAAS